MTSVSTFELVERVVTVDRGKGRRRFYDFVIDGCSLGEILKYDGREHTVTMFWLEYSGEGPWYANSDSPDNRLGLFGGTEAALSAFLGEAPAHFPDRRLSISVCEIDRAPDCGAVIARLTFTDTHVVWDQFGYQNDYEPDVWPLDAAPAELRFDRAQYEAALRDALVRVRHLAAEIIETS